MIVLYRKPNNEKSRLLIIIKYTKRLIFTQTYKQPKTYLPNLKETSCGKSLNYIIH